MVKIDLRSFEYVSESKVSCHYSVIEKESGEHE